MKKNRKLQVVALNHLQAVHLRAHQVLLLQAVLHQAHLLQVLQALQNLNLNHNQVIKLN